MPDDTEHRFLTPHGMFATPEDSDALVRYVQGFTGSERVIAMTVMGMTWNLCSKLVHERDETMDAQGTLNKVRAAFLAYKQALKDRKHAGVAAGTVCDQLEEIFDGIPAEPQTFICDPIPWDFNREEHQEALDELIHEVCSQQAASINNGGPEHQVQFLRSQGWEDATIRKQLEGDSNG